MNQAEALLLALLGGALYVGARTKRRRKRRPRQWWVRGVWGRWASSGPGACYRIRVQHPRSGRVVTGYVGQTRRPVQVRIDEHLLGTRTAAPKVWADTVVDWDVLWSGKCTQGGLNWRERWFIVTRRPLYNVQWNTGNRRRIQPSAALRQRSRRSRLGSVTFGGAHRGHLPAPAPDRYPRVTPLTRGPQGTTPRSPESPPPLPGG